MTYPFRARRGLIIVFTTVFGPTGKAVFHLALDTGASDTMLSPTKLSAIGYNFAGSPQVEVTMGSGVVQVPDITLLRLSALGQERNDFAILAHALPPTSTLDGVLGLDFMRGHLLTVDFRTGQLSLN